MNHSKDGLPLFNSLSRDLNKSGTAGIGIRSLFPNSPFPMKSGSGMKRGRLRLLAHLDTMVQLFCGAPDDTATTDCVKFFFGALVSKFCSSLAMVVKANFEPATICLGGESAGITPKLRKANEK